MEVDEDKVQDERFGLVELTFLYSSSYIIMFVSIDYKDINVRPSIAQSESLQYGKPDSQARLWNGIWST